MSARFETIASDQTVLQLGYVKPNRLTPMISNVNARQLLDDVERRVTQPYDDRQKGDWLVDGIDCEILEPGATEWQRGKVRLRVSLEFCPSHAVHAEVSKPSSAGSLTALLDDILQIADDWG